MTLFGYRIKEVILIKTFGVGKVWPLQLVLVVISVWLAHAILAQGQADRKSIAIDRPPVRVIRDPNPSFAAVAVDSDANMLVVSDENLFRVMQYDRRDNTPPQARFTEPKRVIGGTNTKFEMACGVYIDPKTKEIYVLNGDTQNWMPVFSTEARDNATPSRALNIPGHPFQLTADEDNQLLYMTIQSDNMISVYRKQASGGERPVRTIRGNDTLEVGTSDRKMKTSEQKFAFPLGSRKHPVRSWDFRPEDGNIGSEVGVSARILETSGQKLGFLTGR